MIVVEILFYFIVFAFVFIGTVIIVAEISVSIENKFKLWTKFKERIKENGEQ